MATQITYVQYQSTYGQTLQRLRNITFCHERLISVAGGLLDIIVFFPSLHVVNPFRSHRFTMEKAYLRDLIDHWLELLHLPPRLHLNSLNVSMPPTDCVGQIQCVSALGKHLWEYEASSAGGTSVWLRRLFHSPLLFTFSYGCYRSTEQTHDSIYTPLELVNKRREEKRERNRSVWGAI